MIYPYEDWFHNARRRYLIAAMTECRGNRLEAARQMKVHRNTLLRMLREENITSRMIQTIRDQSYEVYRKGDTTNGSATT